MIKSSSIMTVLILLVLSLIGLQPAHAQWLCGDIKADAGNYGPFDYSNPGFRAQYLPIVDNRHFTPEIERLTAANTSSLASDIGYTLRKFPNHHRALDAMSRLAVRENSSQPVGSRYSIDCWFERAMAFQPRDGTARMIYGIHLNRIGKLDEAIEQMREGLRLQPNNPEIHYNLGLLYLQKRDYANARRYAQNAYSRGYPLPGLRDRLRQAGAW